MPKTSLFLDDKKYRDLGILLSGCMKIENKNYDELARSILDNKGKPISGSTLRRRFDNLEDMSLREINRLGRLLGADIEQLRKAAIRY